MTVTAAPGATRTTATTPHGSRNGGLAAAVPTAVMITVLAGTLAVSVVMSVGLGPVAVPVGDVVGILRAHVFGSGHITGPTDVIVWQLRAPRVLTAAAVGAGLALAGTVTQALVRNPVADPFILGLSSGASAAAVFALTVLSAVTLGTMTLPLAAFGGALLAGAAVFLVARTGGVLAPARLVLVGVAAAQLLDGVTSFLLLRTRNADAQAQVLFWLLGSFSGARWDLTVTVVLVVGALATLLLPLGGRLNVLVLGDEAAAALGVDASRSRGFLLVLVALLTGTAVAMSGAIGFVGMVIPNLTRLLVGANHRRVLPVAALLGSVVLVWADTAARLVLAPTELPVGILTAAIGVPLFVITLRRGAIGSAGVL